VSKFSSIRLKGKSVKSMQKAKVFDDSASIEVVWFNQPFIEDIVKNTPDLYLVAKRNPKSTNPQILSPDYEVVRENTTHIARITPIYALTDKIKQKWLRSKIKWLIDKIDYLTDLEDTLPENIKQELDLIDLEKALINIHFPDSLDQIQKAKKRLAFDEMLAIQLKLKQIRQKNQLLSADPINVCKKTDELFVNSLPFSLTSDQTKATESILKKLSIQNPARILLQGDVGCGKTIVAIHTALQVVKNNHQVVYLAPTTILANQVFKNFKSHLLDEFTHIKIELVTSSSKTSGKADIIVATHAILYENLDTYKNLGLLIVDEQHRFGVEQRNKLLNDLKKHNKVPHFLMMSATPIPRTIASIFFQDMDFVKINTKPKGRKEVKTFLTPNKKRVDFYQWLQEKIKNGNQVFWICPLIEESTSIKSSNVEKTYKELKQLMSKTRIEMLHGRMREDEKNKLIENFKSGTFDILISTTVVEVGIDTQKANIIVIESAERFGLAQLHQLRGRVGRRQEQGFCIIFVSDEGTVSQDALQRLDYFAKTNDGMQVAEYDLKRRGPGEIYGTRQSGIPDLKIADITDIDLIMQTRKVADSIEL
jgi:ATP-dependent DNA helicase RecG